ARARADRGVRRLRPRTLSLARPSRRSRRRARAHPPRRWRRPRRGPALGGNSRADPDRGVNRWRKPAGLAAAITLAALLPFSAFAGRIDGPFGRDSAQVWLVRPSGAPRCVVVFGHGWKVAPPSPAYPWVRQFLPWLDHLTAERCAVIFPRYQLGFGHAPGTALVDAFRRGIATGYARLGRPRLPVVALGYSYGPSLDLTYAANARRWHLAPPVAVVAVFPAGPIPGSPLPLLRPAIRVLIQVGDQDSEAGSAGAQAFWT